MDFEDARLNTLTPKGLLKTKLITGREKDIPDILFLQQWIKKIKENTYE